MLLRVESVLICKSHDCGLRRVEHGLKADAASELHKQGVLARDYGPVLRILNQARKDIWYEGDEPELGGDLEDLAADVEELVEAAGRRE